jgi:hypothetical protein
MITSPVEMFCHLSYAKGDLLFFTACTKKSLAPSPAMSSMLQLIAFLQITGRERLDEGGLKIKGL